MKKTFFLVLALLVPSVIFASVKQLSPATKIWLERQQSQSQQLSEDKTIEAFVSFSSPDALAKLERKGAKVNAVLMASAQFRFLPMQSAMLPIFRA